MSCCAGVIPGWSATNCSIAAISPFSARGEVGEPGEHVLVGVARRDQPIDRLAGQHAKDTGNPRRARAMRSGGGDAVATPVRRHGAPDARRGGGAETRAGDDRAQRHAGIVEVGDGGGDRHAARRRGCRDRRDLAIGADPVVRGCRHVTSPHGGAGNQPARAASLDRRRRCAPGSPPRTCAVGRAMLRDRGRAAGGTQGDAHGSTPGGSVGDRRPDVPLRAGDGLAGDRRPSRGVRHRVRVRLAAQRRRPRRRRRRGMDERRARPVRGDAAPRSATSPSRSPATPPPTR